MSNHSTQGIMQYLEVKMRNSERRINQRGLDLNYPPPGEIMAPNGILFHANSQELHAEMHRGSQLPIANRVQVIDDDLAIIDSRTFAEARRNSRTNHSQAVRRYMFREALYGGLLNRFTDGTVRLGDPRMNAQTCKRNKILEMRPYNSLSRNPPCIVVVNNVSVPLELPCNASPETPTFSCPICIGPLTEPTATKCGHIFCKDCITTAIAAQHKCPNCRQKIGKRGIMRVYLPAAN